MVPHALSLMHTHMKRNSRALLGPLLDAHVVRRTSRQQRWVLGEEQLLSFWMLSVSLLLLKYPTYHLSKRANATTSSRDGLPGWRELILLQSLLHIIFLHLPVQGAGAQ